MNVTTINQLLALLIIIGLAAIGFFIISLFVYKPSQNRALKSVAHYGLHIGFIVALGATLTSLYYSNVVGYAPCVLCWYQRIFIYPQVVLLGIALWKKDYNIRLYSLVLTGFGLFFALYQVLLEHGLAPEGFCGSTGPSCTARYVYEYGFVTIPMMSLTALLLIFISVFATKFRK